jgi:hypothetical protein
MNNGSVLHMTCQNLLRIFFFFFFQSAKLQSDVVITQRPLQEVAEVMVTIELVSISKLSAVICLKICLL